MSVAKDIYSIILNKVKIMTKEEFKQLLKKLKNQTYKSSELEIFTDFFEPAEFAERINDNETIALAEALTQNPHITNVCIINQNVGDIGAANLAKVETIEKLNLWCNHIGPSGAIALTQTNIKILEMQGNIGRNANGDLYEKEQVLHVIEALIKNKSIIELNLQGTYIPDDLLAVLIGKNTTIKTLNLSDNYLTDEALKYIANNKTLEYLNLSKNDISDKGAEYISKNTSLQTLGISKSKITDIGAYFLSKHSNLKKLSMRDNNITIEGLKYILSNTIKKNNQLDEVVVDTEYNKISNDILFAFYRKFNEIKAQQAIELLKVANDDDPIEPIILAGNMDEPADS